MGDLPSQLQWDHTQRVADSWNQLGCQVLSVSPEDVAEISLSRSRVWEMM
jgi:hypothetical protein